MRSTRIYSALLALAGIALLAAMHQPEATIGLGGRCCTPYHPVSWPLHELELLAGAASLVIASLSYTNVVRRKTIAFAAAIIGALTLIGGLVLVATVASDSNPLSLVPPIAPALGLGTFLVLGSSAALLAVAVSAFVSSFRNVDRSARPH